MKPINPGHARWQPAMRTPQERIPGRQGVAPGGRLVAIERPAPWRPLRAGLSTQALAGMGHALQARRQAQLLPLGCALRITSFHAGQATLASTLWDCMAWLGDGWVEVAEVAAIVPPA